MSADNGIYILKTPSKVNKGYEYRVRELMAVENINYDENAPEPDLYKPSREDYKDKEFHSVNEYMPENTKHLEWRVAYNAKFNSNDSKVLIRNARKMWKKCKVFYSEQEALLEASRQLKETEICEYGISFITINEVF